MKKRIALALVWAMLLPAFSGCAEAVETEETQQIVSVGWILPESTELTEETLALLEKAAETLPEAQYEPLMLLGEKDGVFSILCRVTEEGAASYALVSVNENGAADVRELPLEEKKGKRPEKETNAEEAAVDLETLLSHLADAWEAEGQIDRDVAVLQDDLAAAIAAKRREAYLNPDYRVYLLGKDDPAELPIRGRHAFVVLGFQLADGEMTDELKARCDAAAAAARAFPDSILVCSGGATGENNPLGHTEAGLMKEYLMMAGEIAEDRIFIDEKAMTTEDNALHTFAILKEQGVEAITIVTSAYHQQRANMLYFTLAEFTRRMEGCSVDIIGNFACEAEPAEGMAEMDGKIAAYQMGSMLRYLYSGQEKIEKIILQYGAYGEEAEAQNAALLKELAAVNPDAAARWESILALWKHVNSGLTLHPDVLPDGLPDTDELCIVVLGFQLNPDGSMKEELVERLRTALRSAEKYPNAYVVCTGGGTASENENVTEAGRMAEWLIANGIDSARVIVEDQSLTTAQNAMYTCGILEENYPRVRQMAIVSSDYHIATGTLLFEAEAILRAEEAGQERIRVTSNAAYRAPSGSLPPLFQAGALIELTGDTEQAYEIYLGTYTIHALPPLK